MKSLTLKPLSTSTEAVISVPGSKSYTNRALLIAALTKGSVKIFKPLISDDTEAMLSCLEVLGIKVVRTADCLEVTGDVTDIIDHDYVLHTDLSGTTMRFLLALVTIVPGRQVLRGGPGLQKRPIGDIVESLRSLGAHIDYLEKDGYPPLRVNSSKLSPGHVKVKGSTSSQYLSGLLMIAPAVGDLTIETIGEIVSKPYIDMTLETMKHFNVSAKRDGYRSFCIATKQKYRAKDYTVEGDVSSASYFFAIAALTRSTIKVRNMNPKSIQADMGFLKILEKLGNKVTYGTHEITVIGNGVRDVHIDMEHCPDQAPTMAVLAAFAPGISTITGIQSLRIKETERIAALEQELAKMGIQTSSTQSSLVIHGGNPQPATIATYGDHRMAMSFAVAGMKLPGMVIQDPQVVSKTFPDFWEQLATIVSARNIVLIGMRGSGKTTIAARLSKVLKKELLDIDSLIAEHVGSAIPTIIRKHGWNFFRDQESEVVQQIAPEHGKIISTGGGVVVRPKNISALKKHGFLIWLDASTETLTRRLENTSARPALTSQRTLLAEIEQLESERRQLYESSADVVINTDTMRPQQVIEYILKLVKDNNL